MMPPDADWIELGVAERPFGGAAPSGDAPILALHPSGILVGAADGLGHGPEAAAAVNELVEACASHAGSAVTSVISQCHEALRGTRGAAVSLAAFDHGRHRAEWAGVGNVEAVLVPAREGQKRAYLIPGNGVVGYRMPQPKATALPIEAGDVLIFATDGISDRFAEIQPASLPAQELADFILDHYGKPDDDALAVVVRYRGWPG